MMREIKFRAWDSKAKAMFPVHDMNFCKTNNQLNSIYGVDIYDKDSDYYGDVSYGGSVHKKTGKPGEPLRPKFELMQYTGLKDKNGVEIFDKDIVEIKGHAFQVALDVDGNYEVGYNEYMELCCGNLILFRQLPYLTVIGNIYEHPELLGDSQ